MSLIHDNPKQIDKEMEELEILLLKLGACDDIEELRKFATSSVASQLCTLRSLYHDTPIFEVVE